MTIDSTWCTLKIDDSNMYALMCLHLSNSEEDISITPSYVMDFLTSQGVVYGISDIAIQSMLENVMYEQYVCVAKGQAPTRGRDGYFEFKKSTEDMKKKPLIHEDGTADYKNSLNLATISEGELLAVYIPPTAGLGGMDVFGKELPSLGDGKKAMPLRGRGIVADDTNTNFFAQYSGHIVADGSKLYIDKLYRVDGDLNIEIGNIRFDGDVEIMGDVRSGLMIDAKGNIFVHGHVGARKLTATGNIVIDKGIQGKGTCEINSGEDVVCKYVESCKIIATHDIYADSVLNSTLIAKNRVMVTSKYGKVISSEVYGMCGVIVKEAGNNAGTPSLLRAGLPREYYTRAATLTNLIKESDEKIAAFNHHLEILEKNASESNDPKIAETKMQIIRARIVLSSTKTEYEEELANLNDKIKDDSVNSFINITGTVFEGVRIYIGAYPYLVPEAVKEVSFRIGYAEVIVRPLEDEENPATN